MYNTQLLKKIKSISVVKSEIYFLACFDHKNIQRFISRHWTDVYKENIKSLNEDEHHLTSIIITCDETYILLFEDVLWM